MYQLHNAHVRLYFRWQHFWAEEERRQMACLVWWHFDNKEQQAEDRVKGEYGIATTAQPGLILGVRGGADEAAGVDQAGSQAV